MSTAKEIKTFVSPLIEGDRELALVKRRIVLRPVRHILRCVTLDGSMDPDCINPYVGALFLFDPGGNDSLGAGWRLTADAMPTFRPSDPRMPGILRDVVYSQALPWLRTIETISDLVEWKEAKADRPMPLRFGGRAYVALARGDFAEADVGLREITFERDMILAEMKLYPRRRRHLQTFLEREERAIERLEPLVASRDKAFVAKRLHDFEVDGVRALKIEHLWEPSPFPLELA